MTNEEPPPVIPPRKKLPFEQERPTGDARRQAAVFVYGLLAVALAGIAFYMAMVRHMPPTSGYVAAPLIGAVWFGLRLFMSLNSRK